MKPALIPLALLLALPLAAPQADGQASGASSSTWTITGHETCTEPRLVVGRNITVAAGGVLDLQGCVLAMDSPPYVDQYFARSDEGLRLRIEKGGLLRMEAAAGRPSGIERADDRYGYTVQAFGDVVSVGLPGSPNVISGIEGAHEAQLAFGGLRATGNVTLRHTRFEENWGPSLLLIAGSRLDARDVDFAGYGGLVATRAASVRLANVTATALNTPISISLVRDMQVDGCDVRGGRIGLFVTRSNATLRGCTLSSNGTAVESVDADLTVEDSRVSFGRIGFDLKRKDPTVHASALRLRGTDVVGSSPNATSTIGGTQSTVDVAGGRLASLAGPVVNVTLARLTVQGTALDGPQGIRAVDPFSLRVEGATGVSPHVDVWRTTLVRVVDRAGDPLANVSVSLPRVSGTTNQAGQALLVWHLASADAMDGVDLNGTVELRIVDPNTGKTIEEPMSEKLTIAQVTLARGSGWLTWWTGLAIVVVASLAAAVGWKVWSQRKKA